MAARVRWYRDAWWLRVRWDHNRKLDRRFGPKATDKREAERVGERVNAALVLGTFTPEALEAKRQEVVPVADELRRWEHAYAATWKPGHVDHVERVLRNHLVPWFGQRDARGLRETDLLDYVRAKLAEGLSPSSMRGHLAALQRCLNVSEAEGRLVRNPVRRVSELLRRVGRSVATEAVEVDAWTREEVRTVLAARTRA